jgi:hypothetical protein
VAREACFVQVRHGTDDVPLKCGNGGPSLLFAAADQKSLKTL